MPTFHSILEKFSTLDIVVWGDFVADEFIGGDIARVSREAPVLILKRRERTIVPGGAANAAANLAALGVRVHLVGAIGDDEAGERLVESFTRLGMGTGGLLRVPGRITPTKTRILAGHAHTARQQVVRVDHEPELLDAAYQAELRAMAVAVAQQRPAVLVSDYGYGSVTPEGAQALRAAMTPAGVITVDARYQIGAYSGLTAATPNEPELEATLGVTIGNDLTRLEESGRQLLSGLRCQHLLVTRGKDGMALFEPGRPTRHLPVHGSDQALDVTGAGDTVIAVFTAALAAGADGLTAARLANYAGGIVVMKRGTATVSQDELRTVAEGIS
jgi:rfaE bifunctional protein kinase chain/domain